MELPYFNSLGGFTPDGREYAIYLGPDTHTPAPWVNVIANPTFGTTGQRNGVRLHLVWQQPAQPPDRQWSNDPVMDPPSEALYIRDEETGVFWTPTPSPIREETAYRARHGAGYTVFEHNSHGIEQELTVFVPVDENGGEPIKLQRLRLRNDSSRRRRLSVTYYVEWTLGENRESSQMHVVTRWDDEVQALIARNRYHPEYGDRVAFAAINPPAESYGGDRTSFIGRNRSLGNPAAMERTGLSRRTGAGLDPCAALQVTVEMAPGERAEITCMLGQAESVEEARKLVLTYREGLAVEDRVRAGRKRGGMICWARSKCTPPSCAADFLINRWLLYQSLSCRIWGRSAFYQSGGAFGFRDQLQDVMAFSIRRSRAGARAHPARGQPAVQGRRCPALVASTERRGDPLADLRRPAVASLRRRSLRPDHRRCGHPARQRFPSSTAPLLEDDQHEMFSTPEVASERATLFEHCRRAVTPRPDLRAPWFAPDGDRGLERRDEPGGCRGQRGERLAGLVPGGCASGYGRAVRAAGPGRI